MVYEEVIKLDQALYGYDNGHRLIATSFDIAPKAKRDILILSDMSGPNMAKGFESYLTGYPIEEIGVFAFERTWYAHEMKRPGCVWTHILFINFTDLVQIKNIDILQRFFLRPSSGTQFSYYSTKVLIDRRLIEKNTIEEKSFKKENIYSLIYALYTITNKPIFMVSDSSDQYEKIVLEIWNQQWPGLRRNFYFCTGSMSNRMLNHRSFDVQIVPYSNLNTIKNSLVNGEVIIDVQKINNIEIEDWVYTAIDDLQVCGEFRNFIWHYGADVKEGREAFIPLTNIFIAIKGIDNSKEKVYKLLELVSTNFPENEDALRLKEDLLGKNEPQIIPSFAEKNLLLILATTNLYNSFKSCNLKYMKGQIAILWKNKEKEAKELLFSLINSEFNALGEELLLNFADIINIFDAVHLFQLKPDLIQTFINKNPSLAAESELWKNNINQQEKIFDGLIKNKQISPEKWKNIIYAMLDADIDLIAQITVEKLDAIAVEAMLEWLKKSAGHKQLKPKWKDAIGLKTSKILSWLRKNPDLNIEIVALIATFLDPNSSEFKNEDGNIWLRHCQIAYDDLKENTLINFMAFSLALGFNNLIESAPCLATYSFQIVHDAIQTEKLAYNSWERLQIHMEYVGWCWDKCEKLRRTLVEKFIKFKWPVQYFLEAVKSRDVFSQIFNYCEWYHKKTNFFQEVQEKVKLESKD